MDSRDDEKSREELLRELFETRDRLAAEKTRRRELLRGIFDNVPVLIVMWEPRIGSFTLNRHVEAVLGWTAEDANDGDFMGKVYPDPAYRAEATAFVESSESGWREWNVTSKDGRLVPVDWANIRLADDTVIGIGVDLRKRKQAERALTESERRYRELVQNANSAIIRWKCDGTIAFFNEYAQNLFGYSAEEIVGRHIDILLPRKESTGQNLTGLVEDIVEHPRNYTMNINENVCRDGRRLWIAWTNKAIFDRDGQVSEILAVGSDISERKRAEDALRQSEERYRRLLGILPAAMYMCDIDGVITYHNDQAALLWGRAPRPGDTDERFCGAFCLYRSDGSPLPRDRTPMAAVLRDGVSVRSQEIEIERPDGSRLNVSVSIDPLRDADGKLCGAINVFTDITARKQAESALLRLNETLEQRVAERTELAESRAKQLQALAVELIEAEERERRRVSYLLHDDLQQVVAAARFQLQTARQSRNPENTLENVERLLEESIDKSRRLSRELSPPVLNHAGLFDALEWLAGQFENDFGLEVRLVRNAARRSVSEPLKIFIFRAVQELLSNIVHYAGVKNAEVVVLDSDENMVVTVGDRGRGFDPEILNASAAKSGLGLLSLRERSRYIGGNLEIDSTPGMGSRVILTVPLELRKIDGGPAESADKFKPGDGNGFEGAATMENIRVLFVDDHQIMRQGLIRLVSGKPEIEVVGEAADGLEAIEKVRSLNPDLVVMDVSMPKMDGVEATRRIKAEHRQVRVIGLSMFDDDHMAETMRLAGAEAFLSKTGSSSALLDAIYRFGRRRNKKTKNSKETHV